MDITQVHLFMKVMDGLHERGGVVPPERVRQYRKVRGAALLDRQDCAVLVTGDDIGSAEFVWERYQGVESYVTENGELKIMVSGFDSDGDPAVVKAVLYPAGRWLKLIADVTTVPNPYHGTISDDEEAWLRKDSGRSR